MESVQCGRYGRRHALAPELLAALRVTVPPFRQAKVSPGDLTDPGEAQRLPEVAVLSAIAHGEQGPDQKLVFEALLAGLQTVDHVHANLYADIVLALLPAAARDCLEALMTTTPYRYESDFARRYFDAGEAEGRAEGQAQGRAASVLAVLAARGVEVSEPVRERIASCTDTDQLDLWIRRAATATSAEEIFA